MGYSCRIARHRLRDRYTAAEADLAEAQPALAKITDEEIARLAYSYWEDRGKQGGSAMEDWLRAEGELRGRKG